MSNRKPLLSTIVDNKDLAPKGKCKANNSRYQCQKAKANAVNDTGTLDSTPFPYFVHSLTVWRMFENSRELIPLHIYLRFAWHWPLTSWPQKLIVSCPCPVHRLCQFPSKSVYFFQYMCDWLAHATLFWLFWSRCWQLSSHRYQLRWWRSPF